MKITRQRLREIIKEELSHPDAELADIQNMMGREEDLKWVSAEDELGVTEPRHEGGTPEEKFLNRLTIAAHAQGAKTGADAAQLFGLGDDPDVIAYLDGLIGNPMYRD